MDALELEGEKGKIDAMSHAQMARLWRFAPSGHPYFVSGSPLWMYFDQRFKELGRITPEISKKIGW